jgi:hypothetical protein
MRSPPPFVRGAVLKCRFPYVQSPARPGPLPHYCLFVEQRSVNGRGAVAVCYGTSRLDPQLLQSHDGAILSVASAFIKGKMPGPVSHFVCDHVALVAEDWIYMDFVARLDFMRPDSRVGDAHRQRLYEQFVALEEVMEAAALEALHHCTVSQCFGLPPGKSLR